ncbi:MAG TPA: Crp/Fnr family transcriptional regulator [Candidatus Limnocylindrales bacterium]|nr:Crp/Fnr family transcriptional regulator [Candidatus Limnocylindrales bacterium]
MVSTDAAIASGIHGSRLLASLPQRDLDQLKGDLERVRLDAERSLIHAHAPVRRVFFPESGLVALSVTMADGRTAGVTIVGSEGIVGIAAALAETGVMDAAVLVPGTAQSMPAERFRAATRSSETLRRIVDRYAISLLGHLAQTVACNRLHSLDQRAARWLLLARDRMASTSFPLTQESFADLLGVSRPAVSTVGARFAREGAAEFRRGTVHILDPDRLEKASCECLISDREILAPGVAAVELGGHRLPRNLPRTALGMIRPEIRRAR